MKKHKVTAIRMHQKGDNFSLTGITQSPRGTKTMAGHLKFAAPARDPKERKKAIKKALDELLGRTE